MQTHLRKDPKPELDFPIYGLTLLCLLSACDQKSPTENAAEARVQAAYEINSAQAKADQVKIEAQQKADREISEAKRKAIEAGAFPHAVTPLPRPNPGSDVDKIEDKVKDLLDARPNEATKDLLENAAEDARSAAEDAAALADEAARKADEATRKAGQ